MATGADPPPNECDLVVVGGGILGLAVARELLARRPGARLCLLEREADLASHQTGHSSGIVHAGIYYEPGSLKARLCVEGARELRDYCGERGIPFERSGKLILATREGELERLDELERRGHANGVPGLRRLDASEIAEVEPGARGLAALHSPATRCRLRPGRRRPRHRRRRGWRHDPPRLPGDRLGCGGRSHHPPALARRDLRRRRRLLRRPLGGPPRGGRGRPRGPAHRPLPRRLSAGRRRRPGAGARKRLSGSRPRPSLPRRAHHPWDRRRGADRPERADRRGAGRLPRLAGAAARPRADACLAGQLATGAASPPRRCARADGARSAAAPSSPRRRGSCPRSPPARCGVGRQGSARRRWRGTAA